MIPTTNLPADDGGLGADVLAFARQLALLVGPVVDARDGTLVAADHLALGEALSLGRATNLAAQAEAFADSVSATLAEWEAEYGLPSQTDLSAADRVVRITAKVRAARECTPRSLLTVLAPYSATIAVYEYSAALVAATNPRNVFRLVVTMPAAVVDDASKNLAITGLLRAMAPAHAAALLAVGGNLLFDDAASLMDRDVFGI